MLATLPKLRLVAVAFTGLARVGTSVSVWPSFQRRNLGECCKPQSGYAWIERHDPRLHAEDLIEGAWHTLQLTVTQLLERNLTVSPLFLRSFA